MILHMVLVAAGQDTRMASDSPGQLQRAFDATASLQTKTQNTLMSPVASLSDQVDAREFRRLAKSKHESRP
jgi:hypothetical protein